MASHQRPVTAHVVFLEDGVVVRKQAIGAESSDGGAVVAPKVPKGGTRVTAADYFTVGIGWAKDATTGEWVPAPETGGKVSDRVKALEARLERMAARLAALEKKR